MNEASRKVVGVFLADHLPGYAREHLHFTVGDWTPDAHPDWEWLATCPMLSDGEGAIVTLAAHLWDVPWVVVQDPRSLAALLGAVDGKTRDAWLECLHAVGREMVR